MVLRGLYSGRDKEVQSKKCLVQPGSTRFIGVQREAHQRRRCIMGVANKLLALAILAGAGSAHAQDPNLGRNLAATCANCHGTNGHAVADAKTLAGQPAAEIVQKLADFRSGDQPATLMHQVAPGYTDEQIRLIAEFFAAQK